MRTFDEFLEAAINESATVAPSRAASSADRLDREIAARVAESTAWATSVAKAPVLPGWAKTLRVSLPCSAHALKLAFRRRAFETHPDRPGGSHEAFLAVRAAHDEGLAAVRKGGGTAMPVAVDACAPTTPSWSRCAQPPRTVRPSANAAVV